MIRIGKIVATHGLAGDVILTHILNKKNWLKKDDALFLELHKGSFIPFFVTNVRATQEEECILRFEDITSVEAAKKLVGRSVYSEAAISQQRDADTPLLWVGYTIVDRKLGAIGVIDDVIQTAHQWLAQVQYNGKEVLIPLIAEMLRSAHPPTKTIQMELPDGLLEL